ncbi:DUF433 domain-containing protein [Scytonema hofmannii]|uniref:DUF433 domain-containing protein n=1 Tax=Scytonema hofmannii TaxID=34078 RepID=UPI0009D693CF|nr:DUF433 domain-containing protein [Scytonema hofmannii]
MPVNWREYIVSTPDILRGKPRIKSTRIPVSSFRLLLPNLDKSSKYIGNALLLCRPFSFETHVGGFCLYRREFHSPRLYKHPLRDFQIKVSQNFLWCGHLARH